MSILTREARTGGMIFSLFFSYYFSSNNLKHTYKNGVHYKSLYLMLDGCVYLDSFYMDTLVRLVLLLHCLSELSMLQYNTDTHLIK